MSSEWSHSLLGKFDIRDEYIGLDLHNLFLDPLKAEATAFHEITHSIISKSTEMGLATSALFAAIDHFQHLSEDQKKKLMEAVFLPQKFVQEGTATFIELQEVRSATNYNDMRQMRIYADNLPIDYRERFEQMSFVLHFSRKQQKRFTSKVAHIAMQTSIRSDTPKLQLFEDPERLSEYLEKPDNNPELRMHKLISAIKKNPRALRYKPRKLARTAGIKYFEPTPTTEIIRFSHYVIELTGEDPTLNPIIIDKMDSKAALQDSSNSLLVTNLNLNLHTNSEMLFDIEDIEYEASHTDAVFVSEYSKIPYDDLVQELRGYKFERSLILFRKTGEKFIAVVTSKQFDSLIVNQLSKATYITKWGVVDPRDSTSYLSRSRQPDVILYNHPQALLDTLMNHESGINSYESIHLGYSDKHPFQCLVLKINGKSAIHFTNSYGASAILNVIDFINQKNQHTRLNPKDLRLHSKEINDTLSVMGLPWNIDWVKTMDLRTELFKR